jgi:hypothetical protein
MKLIAGSLKALCIALVVVALPASAPRAQVTETVAKRHMIAAANPHAAKAGLEMMRAGGSAVDAAIATQGHRAPSPTPFPAACRWAFLA